MIELSVKPFETVGWSLSTTGCSGIGGGRPLATIEPYMKSSSFMFTYNSILIHFLSEIPKRGKTEITIFLKNPHQQIIIDTNE
jgi:hypothetical protein